MEWGRCIWEEMEEEAEYNLNTVYEIFIKN